jgi:hypothetical protein
MSEKKIRSIVVKGHEFKWLVKEGWPDFVFIRIWLANQKSAPWAEIKYTYHDHWKYYGEIISASPEKKKNLYEGFQTTPVTPGLVAKIIEIVLETFNPSEKIKSTKYFLYETESLMPVDKFD